MTFPEADAISKNLLSYAKTRLNKFALQNVARSERRNKTKLSFQRNPLYSVLEIEESKKTMIKTKKTTVRI